jgi:aspartate/methionine/tyrosine aminotransferase
MSSSSSSSSPSSSSVTTNVGSIRSNTVRSFKVMDVLRKANELQHKLDSDYDAAVEQEAKAKAETSEGGVQSETTTETAITERIQVLHLEVGQPETGAPKQVADAAIKALTASSSPASNSNNANKKKNVNVNVMGYTDAFGLLELRQRIRQHYIDKYYISSEESEEEETNNNMNMNMNMNMIPDVSQIVITTGSSGAFLLAFTACFDVDDVVAIASSGYPCYRNILQALGCQIATCPINVEYKLTSIELQIEIDIRKKQNKPKIKGLILSSPSNPTGSMLTPTEIYDLCLLCNKENIVFISDEIYHGISFGDVKEATALQYAGCRSTASSRTTGRTTESNNANTENTNIIIINSFSKYYSMPGWRLGWMVVPKQYVQSINKLQQNMFINAPTISQTAALECFNNLHTTEELEKHVTKYTINRKLILNIFITGQLKGLSLDKNVAPADGGFYIYVDLGDDNICVYKNNNNNEDENVDLGSVTMCDKFLDEYYVAFTPGIDFEDPNDLKNNLGNRRFRISYAGSTENINKAMNKFIIFWNTIWIIDIAIAKKKQQNEME